MTDLYWGELERWAMVAGVLRMDHAPAQAAQAFQVFDRWAERELGAYHPARALALTRQAWCQLELGETAQACELYRRAHRILAGGVGRDHPAARRLTSYLDAACGQGQPAPDGAPAAPSDLEGLPRFNPLAGAEGLTVEAVAAELPRLEAAAERLDMDSLRAREADYLIGKMLVEFGLFALAVQAFQSYEGAALGVHGPDHDYLIAAVSEQARCHLELGNYSESCRQYERARRMFVRSHPDDPYIEVLERQLDDRCPPADTRWFFGLAARLADAREFEPAIGAFHAYQRWTAHERGPHHPYVLHALIGRAHCHSRLGQVGSACALYQQALQRAETAGLVLDRRDEITEWVSESCSGVQRLPGDPADYCETWVPPALHRIQPELAEIGRELEQSAHPDEAASAFTAYAAWREGRRGG